MRGICWGEKMKRLVLIAALCAAAAQQPGWAAGKAKTACYSPSAIEAAGKVEQMVGTVF